MKDMPSIINYNGFSVVKCSNGIKIICRKQEQKNIANLDSEAMIKILCVFMKEIDSLERTTHYG